MKLKISIVIFIFGAIGLTSCNNQQNTKADSTPTINYKVEAKKLNALLKKYDEPSQIFNVLTNKPTQLKGNQGTIISIIPNDLITEDGTPLGKSIKIELKELTNQSQLLKSNAQTVSNDLLLVSGGAYYINLTSDGKQLKIKEGKTLKVEIPKLTRNEMSLFYGQRDSLGKMNWELDKEKIVDKVRIKDTIRVYPEMINDMKEKGELFYTIEGDPSNHLYSEKEISKISTEKNYYKNLKAINRVMSIKKFGWINCDRFLEIENKTDLFVNFKTSDSISSANIYLIFKDINSVVQLNYFSDEDNKVRARFENIPIGSKVRLVALTIKDGKVLSYSANLTVKDKQNFTITMKETKEAELKKLFDN
jgi:hypothetical protein